MKRVKYIAQIQQTECGLCVITMLLNYYGAYYSLYDVRKLVDVGRDGMSVADVLRMLGRFGLHSEAFKCQDVQNLIQLKAPFILALKKKHLVIVEKMTKHTAYVIDPAIGRVKYSYEELAGLSDGICIEAVPDLNFQKKKNEHKMFQILFSLMREKKWKYVFFVCLSFFNYLLRNCHKLKLTILRDETLAYTVFRLAKCCKLFCDSSL